MKRFAAVLVTVSLGCASACRDRRQERPQPPYTPTATIKDIMDSVVDPSADVVWNSVATLVDATGTHPITPKTDEEWINVRRGAIRVLEGANLLLMPGRLVARPHEKSENPGVELEPEDIAVNIDRDREQWNRLAKALHDGGAAALRAIDARDSDALLEAGEKMDQVCEHCHATYWYPNQPLPPGYVR